MHYAAIHVICALVGILVYWYILLTLSHSDPKVMSIYNSKNIKIMENIKQIHRKNIKIGRHAAILVNRPSGISQAAAIAVNRKGFLKGL